MHRGPLWLIYITDSLRAQNSKGLNEVHRQGASEGFSVPLVT